MTGCAAPNCSGNSREGLRLFRFPKSPRRRAKWTQNCRRDKWTANDSSRLCEKHFEESQYENIACTPRKLRRTAVPTVFDVPNPPKLLADKRPVRRNLIPSGQSTDIEVATRPKFKHHALEEHSYCTKKIKLDDAQVEHQDVCDPDIGLDIELDGCGEVARPSHTALEEPATTAESTTTEGEGGATVDSPTNSGPENEKLKKLQRQVWRLQKQLTQAKKENRSVTGKFRKYLGFLSEEQREFLLSGKKKVTEFTPEMIKEALQIRFAVGWKGYKFLVKKGYPLPSYSTICNRLKQVDFRPGILSEIILFLQIKSKSCHSKERDCVILIDEMEVAKGLELIPGMKKYVGTCTLGTDTNMSELGSQLLVVMLRGINSNWKQVIGYHILSKSNSGSSLSDFIKETLLAVDESGYHVRGLVSDMGPKNLAVWRDLGLHTGRFCTNFLIPHPARPEEKFAIFADTPHLLKNLKQALLKHVIILPDDVVAAENLVYNKVKVKYLKELVRIQNDKNLKLAPNLTERHFEPTQFEKMKVSMATQVFCVKTASALETVVALQLMNQKALTTAWYIRKIRAWFDILNSREKKTGITRKNRFKKRKILRGMIELFKKLKMGDGRWKPVQTGVILTTESVIELQKMLFKDGYIYFLTSRITSDALESLFSVLRRHGNVHPSCLQAVQALKLITMSQFVQEHNETSGNYEDDGGKHYLGLFSIKKCVSIAPTVALCCSAPDGVDHVPIEASASFVGTDDEVNALNNVLGGVISTLVSRGQFCSDACKDLLIQAAGEGRVEEVLIENRNVGRMIFPTQRIFELIKTAECVTSYHLRHCHKHAELLQHIQHKIHLKIDSPILCSPDCGIFPAIIQQFVRVRLSIHARKIKEKAKADRKKAYASKSASFSMSQAGSGLWEVEFHRPK